MQDCPFEATQIACDGLKCIKSRNYCALPQTTPGSSQNPPTGPPAAGGLILHTSMFLTKLNPCPKNGY